MTTEFRKIPESRYKKSASRFLVDQYEDISGSKRGGSAYSLSYDSAHRCFKVKGNYKYFKTSESKLADLGRFHQILENDPNCYHFHTNDSILRVLSSDSKGFLMDARAIQRLVRFGVIQARSDFQSLAQSEQEEQDEICKQLTDYIETRVDVEDQEEVEAIARKIISEHRLFFNDSGLLTLIDPDTKRIQFTSESEDPDKNNDLFSYLTSPYLQGDIFLSRMDEYKVPLKRLVPYRVRPSRPRKITRINQVNYKKALESPKGFGKKLQHFSEFTSQEEAGEDGEESDAKIILDGFDDMAAAMTQSKTPDTTTEAIQSFIVYPAFLYAVWLGVSGLSDEMKEQCEELFNATKRLAKTKGDASKIAQMIKDRTLDRESIKVISRFMSDPDIKNQIIENLYLTIKAKQNELKSKEQSDEISEIKLDLAQAATGFTAMTSMFSAVASYNVRALCELDGGASGISSGTVEGEGFSMSQGEMLVSPGTIATQEGTAAAAGAVLATVGQGMMTVFATYEAIKKRSEERELKGEMDDLVMDTTSFALDSRLQDITRSHLELQIKHRNRQKFANASLALGQLGMMGCGPLLLSSPPGLFAGVALTLAGVYVNVATDNASKVKFSHDPNAQGDTHKKVSEKYQLKVQEKLENLQNFCQAQRNILKNNEINPFRSIITRIDSSDKEELQKATGFLDALYFKIIMSEYAINTLKDSDEVDESKMRTLRGELHLDLTQSIDAFAAPDQRKSYKAQLSTLIDFAIATEGEIKGRSAGALHEIEEVVQYRNHAMAVVNQGYSTALIVNQIIRRLPANKAITKEAIREAINDTLKHYNYKARRIQPGIYSNTHQRILSEDLRRFGGQIAGILINGFKAYGYVETNKTPEEDYSNFLSAWHHIYTAIEDQVSLEDGEIMTYTDPEEITKEAYQEIERNRAREAVCQLSLAAVNEKVKEPSEHDVVDQVFNDKDLKYKTLKTIGTELYRSGQCGKPNSALEHSGSISKYGTKTGVLSGTKLRPSKMSSKKLYKVNADTLKTQLKGGEHLKPLLKVLGDAYKESSRGAFFNSAYDHMIAQDEIEKAQPHLAIEGVKIKEVPASTEEIKTVKGRDLSAIQHSVEKVNSHHRGRKDEIDSYLDSQLKSQANNLKPDRAYSGCGMKGSFQRTESGAMAIRIEEIFNQRINRFTFAEGRHKGAMVNNESLLKLSITHIESNSALKSIDELTDEEIANAFHNKDQDTTFQIDGGSKITCAAADKKVYVTKMCDSATGISNEDFGSLYNATIHSAAPIVYSKSDLLDLQDSLKKVASATRAGSEGRISGAAAASLIRDPRSRRY